MNYKGLVVVLPVYNWMPGALGSKITNLEYFLNLGLVKIAILCSELLLALAGFRNRNQGIPLCEGL